jgi:transposase
MRRSFIARTKGGAGFVAGTDRGQSTLLPECLDDWVDQRNPIRVIDAFVDALNLRKLGFGGMDPAEIGRPAYHPSVPLKLYIYGYLNRVQSSRRLEREASRNVEVMWLLGRLAPDHKTIADFRKDNGPAIKKVCAQFVELCRKIGLLAKRPWPLMAASSRRSTIVTRISRRLRSNGGARNWSRASRVIWRSSTQPTGRSGRKRSS